MISLVTATGDRPEAFALLERWIAAQDYAGEYEWIVVDDGHTPTRTTMGQIVLAQPPMGGCSLIRNLSIALAAAQSNAVVFLEDDDYYAPGYLTAVAQSLATAVAYGETPARYYHVGKRLWRELPSNKHSSLCATAVRGKALVLFRDLLTRVSVPMIDVWFWAHVREWAYTYELAQTDQPRVVGIKGMPGRPGIGVGHRAGGDRWHRDNDFSRLREWLGHDAECYAGYYAAAERI